MARRPPRRVARDSANALTDVKKLITDFCAQNADAENLWMIMTPATAVAMAIAANSPTLTAQGGSLLGVNVLTSASAGAQIVLLDAAQIVVAEEAGIQLDVAENVTLELESSPANPSTAATVYTSLWQKDLAAIRAEKTVAWKRQRTNCVRLVSGCAYV